MTDIDIVTLFCDLVRVPSPSGKERRVAEFIAGWLADHGIQARADGTAELNGSDFGNLVATVPGAPGLPRILFVAHMDTVETGRPAVDPSVGVDGAIRPSGPTILGADNKMSVAAVMLACQAAAALPEEARPTVYAAFTSSEEVGIMGASVLELDGREVDYVFSVDGSEPVGTVTRRALGQSVFTVVVKGVSAHAAKSPERGVDAVATASRIVAALPVGRQEHGGSLNVAAILGGAVVAELTSFSSDGFTDDEKLAIAMMRSTSTNSISQLALIRGEARAFDTSALESTLQLVRSTIDEVCAQTGAGAHWEVDDESAVPPLTAPMESAGVALFTAALDDALGLQPTFIDGAYSLEANYLGTRFDTVAISVGGHDAHHGLDDAGRSEWTTVDELASIRAVLRSIVRLAGQGTAAG